MKHIICLTKTYNNRDFYNWYTYHKKLNFIIHVIDNDSSCSSLCAMIEFSASLGNFAKSPLDTYEKLSGWPNQWQLFDDILNKNIYNFKDGDYIVFIDDDEYIWFATDYWTLTGQPAPSLKYTPDMPLEAWLDLCCKKDACKTVIMPQILMSTKDYHTNRISNLQSLPMTHYYRRSGDTSAQGKCFIKYNHSDVYQFNNYKSEERGHVPFIFGERKSSVNGYGVSNTTYAGLDPKAFLRLYHYHVKSAFDWELKLNRGSAAVDHQWYDKDIRNNLMFGGYDTPDFTMQQTQLLMDIKEL